ncbi:WIPF3 protein, partial [Eolophus roseicapillus]|nr:WIPF3 protein [Eolophus roseicapilla]
PQASSEVPKLRKEDQKARNALLADIQQGTRLRKVTQINDRSAPQIEKPKGTNRDGVNPAVNKSGPQQPLGGLFAGGFPVLRPAGQRDMSGKGFYLQLPAIRAAAPKPAAPPNSSTAKASSVPSHPTEGSKAAAPPDPPSVPRGAGAGPGRPSLPAPPPPPPASSKPSLTFPPPPAVPPPAERSPKGVSPSAAPPAPLPPQPDKLTKFQAGASHAPPPPPPPPPLPFVPPSGFPSRTTDFPAAAPTPAEGRDSFNSAPGSADVPPPLPPKSPNLLSQFHKPSSIQSLPLPPTPGLPQPVAAVAPEMRKKRPGRGTGTGVGKLVTPPQPPARSPTTELTSKSGVSAWAAAHDPFPPLKNGNIIG